MDMEKVRYNVRKKRSGIADFLLADEWEEGYLNVGVFRDWIPNSHFFYDSNVFAIAIIEANDGTIVEIPSNQVEFTA